MFRSVCTFAVGAFLLGGVARASDDAGADSGKPFVKALAVLTSEKGLRDAQLAVSVVDVSTGRPLAATAEHQLVNPASNAKIYTAACALGTLHGNHRYQTALHGTIKNGAVQGLTLRGFGDPSLTTREFSEMAKELHSRGVRRVEGDLWVDQHYFDAETTPPAFEQQPNEWAPFRAPVSAVAVNENTITLTVRPGSVDSPAQVSFEPPGYVDVEGAVKTASEGADNVVLTLVPSGARLKATVAGSVSRDSKLVRYTRRVEDPQLLAGYVLKFALEQQGIKVESAPKLGPGTKNALLVHHESEPLSMLLYSLGKQSDNFYAEMIFKSIAAESKKGPAKSTDSVDICTKWLEKNGASDTGLLLKNGSGLFDANRVTTHSMTRLLAFLWNDPAYQSEFVSQLAIGGVDGTLAKRFRALRAMRILRAKTGTLDDVISLSGYILGPAGRAPLAFSVIFNKVSGHGSQARIAIDKFVESIAKDWWTDPKK